MSNKTSIGITAEQKEFIMRKKADRMKQLGRLIPDWEIIEEMITAYKKAEGELK